MLDVFFRVVCVAGLVIVGATEREVVGGKKDTGRREWDVRRWLGVRMRTNVSADDGQTFAAPEECLQCHCQYTWLRGTGRYLETITGQRHTKLNTPKGVAHTLLQYESGSLLAHSSVRWWRPR